jgi:hypothetical protein
MVGFSGRGVTTASSVFLTNLLLTVQPFVDRRQCLLGAVALSSDRWEQSKRHSIIHLVVTLAIAPLSLPAIAQPASMPIDPRAAFSLEAKPGTRLEEYVKRMRVIHRRTDVNADAVVSNADLDYYRSDAAASARARSIGELLRYDLDGDGIVTRAEVVQAETRRIRIEARQDPGRAKVGYSIPQNIDRAADDRMRADPARDLSGLRRTLREPSDVAGWRAAGHDVKSPR